MDDMVQCALLPPTFDRFYAEHRDPLRAALTRLTRDRGVAEDLAQEAFVALWARWDRMANVDDPEGYLYRTALNLFRKRCRRRAPEFAEPFVPDAMAAVEARVLVAGILAPLTRQQRRATVMVDLLGYTPTEAAEALGMLPSTLRVHLARARRRMRRMLDTAESSAEGQRACTPRLADRRSTTSANVRSSKNVRATSAA